MSITIQAPEGPIKAKIELPASKSESNRALIIQALCEEDFVIRNLSEAEDTITLQRILESHKAGVLDNFDVGAGGTTMRFLTAYLATQPGTQVLDGSARMRERPIGPLVDALRTLGADIEYTGQEGFPPLKIGEGMLLGGPVTVDGSISSQYISALFMIGPVMEGGLTLTFSKELVSKPYVGMTMLMMQYFGARTGWLEDDLRVEHGAYEPVTLTIESDWSAASYWYSMAALSPSASIELMGLRYRSLQGDRILTELFEPLGVRTDFGERSVTLKNSLSSGFPLASIELDCTPFPDLAQTLACTAAALGIGAHLTGLQTLRIKETDRLAALKTELAKMNVKTEIIGESEFVVHESQTLQAPSVELNTYEDHRMAMVFAPLCLKAGPLAIEDPKVVGKSYPGFWDDLAKVGFVTT